jgi:hypothetical protein
MKNTGFPSAWNKNQDHLVALTTVLLGTLAIFVAIILMFNH